MAVFTAISFVHSRDLHWFYVVKSVFVFASMHAVLIWYLVKAHGVSWTNLAGEKKVTGSAHAWLVLRAFNSGLGAASSLTVNQGDMTRYARKPGDAIWVSCTRRRDVRHCCVLTNDVDHPLRLSHRLGAPLPLRHPGGRLCQEADGHGVLEHVGRAGQHAEAVPG